MSFSKHAETPKPPVTGMCNFCQYGKAATKMYRDEPDATIPMVEALNKEATFTELCEICAETYNGNMAQYPNHYPFEVREIATLITNIGNRILTKLDEIAKNSKPSGEEEV